MEYLAGQNLITLMGLGVCWSHLPSLCFIGPSRSMGEKDATISPNFKCPILVALMDTSHRGKARRGKGTGERGERQSGWSKQIWQHACRFC